MKTTVTGFALVLVLFLAPVSGSACSTGPTKHFAPPTFLDPDYEPLPEWRRSYNRRTMFYKLARQYAVLDTTTVSVDDSLQRANSHEDEPDYYSRYQQAATLFHAQQYDSALVIFKALKTEATPDPYWWQKLFGIGVYSWVAEASTYMIARCQLIISQNRYDGYWRPIESVDQELLALADTSYQVYLEEYPDGLYAESARNIKRKIFRLAGCEELLDESLKQLMLAQFPSGQRNDTVSIRVVDEFLTRFRGTVDFEHDSPMLTAFALLGKDTLAGNEVELLETRERDFASYPGLFRYVRALGCYRLKSYQELLDKTPPATPDSGTIWLSTELLRARAMIATGDSTGARASLEQMFAASPEDAVTLELGILLLNMGKGLELFTYGSPISDYDNLRVFATYGLTDEELEAGLAGDLIPGDRKEWLARELARRYALSGRNREANELLQGTRLVPFIGARKIFETLAVNPDDIDAKVELGEFLYEDYITPGFSFEGYRHFLTDRTSLSDLLPRCEPCGQYLARATSYRPPIDYFLAVVEHSLKSKQRSEAEAKALHYIVISTRPGGYYDRCTWRRKRPEGAFTMTSKEAFRRLHTLYKDSPWAEKTPYHY